MRSILTATILTALALSLTAAASAAPACRYTLAAPHAYPQAEYDRVFTADFDGDGNLDAGFAARSGELTIRYGLGDGRMSQPQTLALNVWGVADVVGNALPDLISYPGIFVGIGSSMAVLPNAGGRSFGSPRYIAPAGEFVVADFTNDGRDDLVVFAGENFRVYVRDGNDLDPLPAQELDTVPRELNAADINGDGDMDIVLLSRDRRSVRILRGNGSGAFTHYRTLHPEWSVDKLVAADIDGNGYGDVVAISQSPNDFDTRVETFHDAASPAATITVQHAQGFISGAIARDLNDDGAPDLIVLMTDPGMGQRAVVYFNKSGALERVQLSLFVPAQSPIETGDFNGDGIAELVVRTGNGFALVTGNGDGTFFRARPLEVDGPARASGDVNGDGADDFLVQDDLNRLHVAMNDGAGNFSLELVPGVYSYPFTATISGREVVVLDESRSVITPVYVFRRKPSGAWEEVRKYVSDIHRAQTHDFDGDGASELVLIDEVHVGTPFPDDRTTTHKTLLVIDDDSDQMLLQVPLGGHLTADVVVADVTADGHADLLVTKSGTSENSYDPPNPDGAVLLFAGRGDGTFADAVTIHSGINPGKVEYGDFNADGHIDLAYTHLPETLFLAYGTSNGFATPAAAFDGRYDGAFARDLNRDGVADLLALFGEEATLFSGSSAGLLRGDMFWLPGHAAGTVRLRTGALDSPYFNDGNVSVVDAACVTTRRRSIGR